MKERFKQSIKEFALNDRFLFLTYLILVFLIAAQSYFDGPATFDGRAYTHYNNYLIFKNSFFHLIHYNDLYQLYLSENWDLYKYSPTFALLMSPMAVLPDFLGLFLWDSINALLLFFAIRSLPIIDNKSKKYMLWFILPELITSLQNEQSNGLIAALVIISFLLFQRKNFFLGTLCIVLSAYIKLFGIVAIALLILYPDKIKNIAYTIFWGCVLWLLPLCVISFSQLKFLYASWGHILSRDATGSNGLSVFGWLYTWFGIAISKPLLLLTGILTFCIPLLNFRFYKNFHFRLLMLSSVLLWIVIFNHMAESPTFIIAISGVALWYFPQERKIENLLLLVFAFIFTSLSPTDLFPRWVRINFFQPYDLKVFPCILIWVKLLFDMLLYKTNENANPAIS